MPACTDGEWTGIIIGLAALIVGVIAVVVVFLVERWKRPVLRIDPHRWHSNTGEFKFAEISVSNEPLRGLGGRYVNREAADDARVSVEWRRNGALVIARYDARWSDTAEPLTRVSHANALVETYDQAKAIASRRYSVPASNEGAAVALAILRDDGTASAWGPESYAFTGWSNPAWTLSHGTYEVDVHVTSPSARASRRLRLAFSDGRFPPFEFEAIE